MAQKKTSDSTSVTFPIDAVLEETKTVVTEKNSLKVEQNRKVSDFWNFRNINTLNQETKWLVVQSITFWKEYSFQYENLWKTSRL